MKAFLQKHINKILIVPVAILLIPTFVLAEGMNYVEQVLWDLVVGLFGRMMAFSGLLLDTAINTFVIGFGDLYTKGGIGLAIDTAWYSVRDIFNITFIFGLVYIGIKMILDSSDNGTKKWLVHLIMAAILVNFSLYISKFVIDVSNVVASEIAMSGFTKTGDEYPKITHAFADSMGMTSIFNTAGSSAGDTYGSGGAWGYIFGTMIFFVIGTFVFGAGAFLLIIRAVVLLFYLILSPFMFIGWVFPRLQKYTDEYWSGFLGRAFFAPLYILFLYLSSKILGDFTEVTRLREGNAEFGKVLFGSGGDNVENLFFTTFIPFMLASVFMIMSIIIANKLGANGSDAVISTGKKLSRGIGRFATRKTVGYGAELGSEISRGLRKGYERVDAGLSETRTGRAARGLINVGTLGATTDRSMRAVLGAGENLSIAGSETAEQRRKYNSELQVKRNKNNSEYERYLQNTTHQETLASPGATLEERRNAQNAVSQNVRSMSNDEINSMSLKELTAISHHLTDSQVSELQKSGKLTNQEMGKLETSRDTNTFAEIETALASSNATTADLTATMDSLNRIMATMSNERLTNLVNTNPSLLTNHNIASRLSSAQMDTLRQSGNLTDAGMTSVTTARDNGLITLAKNGSLGNPGSRGGSDPVFQDKQRRSLFKNAQDAGKLPVRVLAAEESRQYLTPRIIEEFLNNNPSNTDIAQVRASVQEYLTPTTPGATAPPVEIVNSWTDWTSNKSSGKRFGLI